MVTPEPLAIAPVRAPLSPFLANSASAASRICFFVAMVNYDYNHQNGTHKELFKITNCNVNAFEEKGYYATVKQELIRANNTLGEIIKNPVLGILPKTLSNTLEYAFPSTTAFFC